MSDADAEYADRYSVQYSVYGPNLDVTALLAEQRPTSEFEAWHKGKARGTQRVTKTAGVRIQVIEDGRPTEVIQAIERFIAAENPFLEAAARRKSAEMQCMVCLAVWVYAMAHSKLSLPASLLRRMSDLSQVWEVTRYPCAD